MSTSAPSLVHTTSPRQNLFVEEAAEAAPKRSARGPAVAAAEKVANDFSRQMMRDMCPFQAFDAIFRDAKSSVIIAGEYESGTGDRIVGIISLFYVALLSGRDFKISNGRDSIPNFDAAYTPGGYLDWRCIDDVLETKRPLSGHDFLNMNKLVDDLFLRQNMSKFPSSSVPNAFVLSNRGRTYKMFSNRYHSRQLQNLGLTRDTAFACGFQYLFQPNQKVYDSMNDYVWTVLRDESVLKISINIRAGDSAFSRDAMINWHRPFFDCAQQIEDSRSVSDQRVVWYLTSESLTLRRWARRMYGDKVITDLESSPNKSGSPVYVTPVDGTGCGNGNGTASSSPEVEYCRQQALNVSMIYAAAQLEAMALADYHIISSFSNFGKIGALMKVHPRRIYEIARREQNLKKTWGGWGKTELLQRPKCGFYDPYTSYERLANSWAGI